MTLENLNDFNDFYMSGNRNECALQASYLLIYFTCDVNMTYDDIDEVRQPLGQF